MEVVERSTLSGGAKKRRQQRQGRQNPYDARGSAPHFPTGTRPHSHRGGWAETRCAPTTVLGDAGEQTPQL